MTTLCGLPVLDYLPSRAQSLLPISVMAYLVLSWVSISTVFCLALVRAAVRRVPQPQSSVPTLRPASKPKETLAVAKRGQAQLASLN